MAEVIIYFDYELQQGADMTVPPGDWGMREYENTERLLKLLDHYGVHACFAALGTIAEGDDLPYSSVSQLQKIHEHGHEIGSHSYYHNLTSELTPEQLHTNLKDSREVLESATGAEVTTFVPPGNIPFNFYGIPIIKRKSQLRDIPVLKHFRLQPQLPSFRRTVLDTVREAGFTVYREYDWFSNTTFHTEENGLCIDKLNVHGFGTGAQEYVAAHANEDIVITCYGHPKALSQQGEESFEALETLLNVLQDHDVATILPRELEERCSSSS